MNFRPELAQAVIEGRKTVTRRLVSDNPRSPWWEGGCSLRVNRSYAVCPGRGKHAIGRVRVVNINGPWPLGHITDDEAQREGFPDAVAFEDAFAAINGRYDYAAFAWRIEFVAIPPGDEPLWEDGT